MDLPLFGDLQCICCLCTDLHTTLKLLIFSHSLHVMMYAVHCLWRYPVPQYLLFSACFCFLLASLSYFCVLHPTESNSLATFILFSASFCTLFASSLWVHNSILSHVVSTMSSSADTSLKISLIISHHLSHVWTVLLMLCHILCNLIVVLLPTICPSISRQIDGFLCSFLNCNDSPILLWHGRIFHIGLKSGLLLFLPLHLWMSFSSCKLSQCIQFFMTGTLSSSVRLICLCF